MDELRDRLEQALIRRAARLLDEMADRTGDELTDVLRELDERIAQAGAVAQIVTGDPHLREQLTEREVEVARLRASISALRVELDEARAEAQEHARQRAAEAASAQEHERRARELQQRLAEATLRRSGGESVFDGRQRLDQREGRLAELEAAADERLRELDELERGVLGREARLELREDEIERAERELELWEERLSRRESELAVYVGQVQEALLERH